MYFISKKSENIWLIGLHNHNLYGIGDKDGQLFIYQKDVFDAGEWDEFAKLDIKIHSHKKCQSCERKMPAAAGIIETKLWIMASGTMLGKNPTKSKPHVFCVDLESKEVTTFKTKKSDINDFIKVICMHCDTLQISFEEEIDGKSRFMVLPNRLRTAALFMNFSNPFPSFKQFCFDINDEDKTCTFGYFYRLFNNSKGVFVAGITNDQFKFGIQNLMYDGLKQIPAGGDYRNYTMLNFVQNDDTVLQTENMFVEIDDELLQGHTMIYSEFYRDNQNELYCVIKEKKDNDLIELSIFKPNMDMENETVR
uniref:Uncharacterized protein n=1 Tax=Panagrolaimus sp. ES5 TaxID=591445 RepID=A0AC34FKH3_9BILA